MCRPGGAWKCRENTPTLCASSWWPRASPTPRFQAAFPKERNDDTLRRVRDLGSGTCLLDVHPRPRRSRRRHPSFINLSSAFLLRDGTGHSAATFTCAVGLAEPLNTARQRQAALQHGSDKPFATHQSFLLQLRGGYVHPRHAFATRGLQAQSFSPSF